MKTQTVQSSGLRKRAVARASIKPGTGKVRINKVPLEIYQPKFLQMKIKEAILLAGEAGKKVDIDVLSRGGGISGQAEAIRLAIGRALVAQTKGDSLKKTFLDYDRTLLVADVRRKERSKPNCRGKARRKRQKSYR